MAAMGSVGYGQLYESILARASAIWACAQDPEHATAELVGLDQQMGIGAGHALFATPGLDAIFVATGWVLPRGSRAR
jgi:hypothetical protein